MFSWGFCTIVQGLLCFQGVLLYSQWIAMYLQEFYFGIQGHLCFEGSFELWSKDFYFSREYCMIVYGFLFSGVEFLTRVQGLLCFQESFVLYSMDFYVFRGFFH
jgi:hypothetical protein